MIASGLVCRELIGRSSELAYLLACARPSPARRSAVVVLRGEAGVGKSRLATEFLNAAAAEGMRGVTVGAREYTDAPYAPFFEAFELLGDGAAETELQGRAAEGADEKARRFSLFARQLGAFALAQPRGLALVIEDLHWADGGTLELLQYVSRRLSREPICVVATYRSEDLEADSARARLIAGLEREAGQVIALEPLAGNEIDRLLSAVVRDAGRSIESNVLAEIRDLSDGRPLFAEELLRGVVERISRDGSARAMVPTSIRATVRERFASLGADDRDVLLHAAVVGRRFSVRFLTRLGGFDPAAVYRALRRARDLQLVVEESEDGDCFAFRHALTREAVYSELLRAETRELHARVAAALAREDTVDVAAIAEHAYRARDAEHAVAWNQRAGETAAGAFAHGDAARYFERAAEFALEPLQRGALAERVADAWYATGDVERSVNWLARAMADYERAGALAAVPRLAIRRARMLWELGRHAESVSATDAIVAELGEDQPALRFEAITTLAGLLNVYGRPEEALEHLQRAELLLDRATPQWVTRFHGVYGYCLGLLYRGDEARGRFATAVVLAREHGDHDVLLRTLNNHGNVELNAGTVGAARTLFGEALTAAEHTKNLRIVAWVSQNAAVAALLGGDIAAARMHLARSSSIEHGVSIVHRWRSALALRIASLVGADREGERAEAALAFEDALLERDEPSIAALAGALAYDALAEAQVGPAEVLVRRALEASGRPEAPYWLLAAAARAGDADSRTRARALLERVSGRAGAHGARGLLALSHAREALRKRKREDGTLLAEEAAEAFRTAGWLLDEADALEVAGRLAEATALFRRAGAVAEVRRLTETGSAPARRRGDSTLTAREREIVTMVVAGRTARAIADALVISERTVETHVAAAYRKLGVSNRAELAALVGENEPVAN